MVTLESGFERKAQAAFVEDIHDTVADEPGNIAFQMRQQIAERFEAYADRNDYDLQDTIDTLRVTDVDRRSDGIHVTLQGDHPIGLFEFGVSPHTIRGDPLHFYWEEKDQWIMTDEVNWGSETGGIPEARAFRDMIHWLRGEIQRRDAGGRFA